MICNNDEDVDDFREILYQQRHAEDECFLPYLSSMTEEIATIHEDPNAEITLLKQQLQSTQTELDFLSKKLVNTEQLYETAIKQIEELTTKQSELDNVSKNLAKAEHLCETATKQIVELKSKKTEFDIISKKLVNTEKLYEAAAKQIEELKSTQAEFDVITKKLVNTEQLYEAATKCIEELSSAQTNPDNVTSKKLVNPEQLCDIATKRIEELKLKQSEPNDVVSKKLSEAEELYEIARKRVEELLTVNEKLSQELHEYKVKASGGVDRAVQVDRAEFTSRRSAVSISEPVVGEASSSSEQVIVSPWADVKHGADSAAVDATPPKSIAESLKETAEAAIQQSGFVFDESTGLYYDYGTGYYYNHEHSLYFDPNSGTYFYYDSATGESQFHSKVDVGPQQQPPPNPSQYYPPSVATPAYPPPVAMPSYNAPPPQQQMMRPPYRGPPVMPYGVVPPAADTYPRNNGTTGDWCSDGRGGGGRHYYESGSYRGDNYKHDKHYRSSEQRSCHQYDSRDRDVVYYKSSKSKRSYYRTEAERESYDAHKYRKRKYKDEYESERKTSHGSRERDRDHERHHRRSTRDKKSRDWTSAERTTQELQQRLRRERRKKKEERRRKEKVDGEESETNEGHDDDEFMLVDETTEGKDDKDDNHVHNVKKKGDDLEDGENTISEPYKEMYEAAKREFSDLQQSSNSASNVQERPVSPDFPSSSSSSASVSYDSESDVEPERKMSRSVLEDPREVDVPGSQSDIPQYEQATVKQNESDATLWPPCIRLIVQKSLALTLGSLFVITCQGGTIGREGDSSHVIPIPDEDISELHAEITYSKDQGVYEIQDKGSQSGTYLNGVRLSEANTSCNPHILGPGDVLRLGDDTELLLHIHPGTETCDGCEPGVVMAKFQELQTKEVVVLSNADKQKIMRKQMKNIKRKYGLQNMNYENNTAAIHRNPGYKDKAGERRKNIGSDNPYEKKAAPASVHRPISEQNIGHQMLAKMGWKAGESLGSQNTGIIDPVTVSMRSKQSAGLGSVLGVERSLDNVVQVGSDQKWIKAQQRMQQLEKTETTLQHLAVGGVASAMPLTGTEQTNATVPGAKQESPFVVGGVLDSESKDPT